MIFHDTEICKKIEDFKLFPGGLAIPRDHHVHLITDTILMLTISRRSQ